MMVCNGIHEVIEQLLLGDRCFLVHTCFHCLGISFSRFRCTSTNQHELFLEDILNISIHLEMAAAWYDAMEWYMKWSEGIA